MLKSRPNLSKHIPIGQPNELGPKLQPSANTIGPSPLQPWGRCLLPKSSRESWGDDMVSDFLFDYLGKNPPTATKRALYKPSQAKEKGMHSFSLNSIIFLELILWSSSLTCSLECLQPTTLVGLQLSMYVILILADYLAVNPNPFNLYISRNPFRSSSSHSTHLH